MMRSLAASLILALSMLATAGAGRAATPEPYQLVRALEQLQDEVARGSTEARVAQRSMLDQMAAQFLKAEPSVWENPRNIQAAVMFVLNGGSPTVIRKVIDFKALSDMDRNLMVGALAYVAGREQEARLLLSRVDLQKQGAVLGGNVALALGSLLIRDDTARAIKLLAMARLLLPGTLIEEAALRRQAFIHFEANDVDLFAKVSAQYLRRFGKSVYSPQFRERLDLAIKHLARSADPSVIDKLSPLFDESGEHYNSDLVLLLSREGLLHGRIAIARSANERATQLHALDDLSVARLKLYMAFAQIFTSDPEKARGGFLEVGKKVEHPEDLWLVEAGTRLLDQTVLWPPAVATNPAEAGRETSGIQADATKLLLASGELLARADK